MRETQNSPATDFDAGVQAGLKTAVDFLERLAVRVQKSESAGPAPSPQPARPQPVPAQPLAARVNRP